MSECPVHYLTPQNKHLITDRMRYSHILECVEDMMHSNSCEFQYDDGLCNCGKHMIKWLCEEALSGTKEEA